MTSTTNPSTMFADALAQFSKAAHNAFTEIENQSRIEVLRAASETREAREEAREARAERDKLSRDLLAATLEVRAATLDAQGWKQESADAKAALAQAELTIAHQAELQHETIAQLRREVSQWKDQSRNWQEHFLSVEQERCVQSSRISELMKLPYTQPSNTAFFTPKKKYANATHPYATNSAPSSITTKGATIPSPTQPPSYKSAAPLSTSDSGSCSDSSSPQPGKNKQGTPLKRQRDMLLANSPEEAPQTSIGVQYKNLSSSKRKTKGNNSNIVAASSSQREDPQTPAASRTTLIRRVQAVIHVKREESDDDSAEDVSAATNFAKDEASDEDESVSANQRRSSRRSRRIVKDDEEDVEQNYLAADGNPVRESRHLRHRNAINYREEADDEDDEDELMMGAEENHEEVYGTQRVETLDTQRSKQQLLPPPKKKRKLAAR
ncbi:hypothetical protein BYT27DRAFT_7189218 [Phlegmacium glaucopus]|nr:hypothetical protein BYT27DRAFT_7189218 [Phlegmacium glaucopus]